KRGLGRPIRILEIGSYMGASALTWARAVDVLLGTTGHLLCVDPWTNTYMDTAMRQRAHPLEKELVEFLGPSDMAYRAFLRNVATAPASIAVEHRRGLSGAVLPSLPDASFD